MQLFDVRSSNPDLARKGRVLAISALVGVVNLVMQEWGFFLEQVVLVTALAGLFWLNRRGYVMAASLLFVGLLLALPFVVFPTDGLIRATIALALPIVLGGLLLWPWLSVVISGLMIAILAALGLSFDELTMTGSALLLLGLAIGLLLLARRVLKRIFGRRNQPARE